MMMDEEPQGVLIQAACIGAAYLCGSFPTGVWVGRYAGVDVRSGGSGNIGATNVARTAGARAAVVTLLGDICKGVAPVLVSRALGLGPLALAGVATAAVLGHLYSALLRFSGGKGVATAFGAFLGIAPPAALVTLVVFGLTVSTTRYVSVASMVAALALPVAIVLLGYAAPSGIAAAGVAVLVILRHRDNLRRLWRGVEPKVPRRR